MSELNFREIVKPEHSRIYIFPDGSKFEVEGVYEISVSESGTHRLNTESGKKYIVSNNWIAIEIIAEEWSF